MQDNVRDMLSQILVGKTGGDPTAYLRNALMARLGSPSDDPMRIALDQMLSQSERRSNGGQGANEGDTDAASTPAQMRRLCAPPATS